MISSFSKRYLINTHHPFSEVRRARISLMLTDRRLNAVGPSKGIAFSEKTPHNCDLESHASTLSIHPPLIFFTTFLSQPHLRLLPIYPAEYGDYLIERCNAPFIDTHRSNPLPYNYDATHHKTPFASGSASCRPSLK